MFEPLLWPDGAVRLLCGLNHCPRWTAFLSLALVDVKPSRTEQNFITVIAQIQSLKVSRDMIYRRLAD